MADFGMDIEAEIEANYVKLVSEANGVNYLPDEAVSELADEVTFRVKELIQQAKKFMVRGRRSRLSADDIDRALSSRNVQPIFGYGTRDNVPFRFAGSHGRDLFVLDDKEVDVGQLANANPPKAPLEVHLKGHWLAIDGIQPAVPENPVSSDRSDLETNNIDSADRSLQPSGAQSDNRRHIRKTEQLLVKTAATHSISMEQQVFFKEVTESCVGPDEGRRAEALQSLSTDAGLMPLLPRFALAIAEGVNLNIVQQNLAVLIYLMRMTQALVTNPTLNLERVLHDLLAPIISCILSRKLCARPETDNHWALREFAGRLLVTLCRTYNDDVNNLRGRVTQTLASLWRDPCASCAALYGALFAFNELGPETLQAVVIGRIRSLFPEIRRTMREKSNVAERLAAEKLHTLIIKSMVNLCNSEVGGEDFAGRDVHEFREHFGELGDVIFKQVQQQVGTGTQRPHAASFAISASAPFMSSHSSTTATAAAQQIVERRSLTGQAIGGQRPNILTSVARQHQSAFGR